MGIVWDVGHEPSDINHLYLIAEGVKATTKERAAWEYVLTMYPAAPTIQSARGEINANNRRATVCGNG